MFIGTVLSAQVGVNTTAPKTTMDVSAKKDSGGNITDNTQIFGLQAPRLTRAELTANTATYGADQQAALVYITDISGGNATGQRININSVGYYSFDGTLWQKIKVDDTNIYNSNGTLTSNRTLNNGGQTLEFIGSDQYTQWTPLGYLYQRGLPSSTFGNASIALIAADKNSDGFNSRMDIQAFPESTALITANSDATGLQLQTSTTINSAPITFSTSAGANAFGTEKMRITGDGNIGMNTGFPTEKLDNNGITRLRNLPLNGAINAIFTLPAGTTASATQDQTFTGTRTVVADTNGVLGYVNGIPSGQPWNNVADGTPATANTQNIYQMGKVGVMTNNPTGLFHTYNNSASTNPFTVESDNAGAAAGNDSYFYGYGSSATPGLFFLSAKGTKASPGVLQNGNLMGEYNFGGYLSTGWNYSLTSVRGAYDGDGTTLDSSLELLTASTVRMRILANGNVGIGTSAAKSKVHVATGDVYVEQVGSGIIMKSPNGNCWRVTVSNTGTFASAAITCP